MSTTTFFLIFIPILSIILLTINLIFAPHNAYLEKNTTFECGFHSFLGQNRTQFSISFFIYALLFLLFDLEILLVYPYSVSAYTNDIYGLITMLIFFLVLTFGFAFELGKNALNIESKQMLNLLKKIFIAIIKTSNMFLFYISIIFIYIIYNIVLLFLVNIGFIDLSVLSYELCTPGNENQPLNSYPEYRQVNNLEEMYRIKQNLFHIKQTYQDRLLFNRPETSRQIAINLQRVYDENICTIQDRSLLHPYVSYSHQVHWLEDLAKSIENYKREYFVRIQQDQQYHQILAECNHRIQAASTRINQLGGSNS